MKLFIPVYAVLIAAPLLFASDAPASAPERGTILSVDKQLMESPAYGGGDNPSDASLRNTYYAYNVQVQTNCGVYEGYYESPYDYLPSQISAESQLPLRLTKRRIYFELTGDREMEMHVIHRRRVAGTACPSNTGL